MDKISRKRTSVSEGKGHEHIKCVIAELENVLVPVSFIKDTLHGHVRKHVGAHIEENYEKAEVKKFVEELRNQKVEGLSIPETGTKEEVANAVVEHVKALLGKSDTCHKVDSLVLALLKVATTKNELKIELYKEVGECLKAWVKRGVKLVVLTRRSEQLISTLLLTACDGLNESDIKVESLGDKPASVKETYVAVADNCQVPPQDILFITQCHNEAVAASAAGMEAVVVKRGDKEGKGDVEEEEKQDKKHSFTVVQSLSEVMRTAVVPCKQGRPDEQPSDVVSPAAGDQ